MRFLQTIKRSNYKQAVRYDNFFNKDTSAHRLSIFNLKACLGLIELLFLHTDSMEAWLSLTGQVTYLAKLRSDQLTTSDFIYSNHECLACL